MIREVDLWAYEPGDPKRITLERELERQALLDEYPSWWWEEGYDEDEV